jgi:hypothetical protein
MRKAYDDFVVDFGCGPDKPPSDKLQSTATREVWWDHIVAAAATAPTYCAA